MTAPDFFLWGHLKDRVFARGPEDIDQLREFITEEFNNIPQEIIQRACRSVPDRYRVCIEIGGRQIKLYKDYA